MKTGKAWLTAGLIIAVLASVVIFRTIATRILTAPSGREQVEEQGGSTARVGDLLILVTGTGQPPHGVRWQPCLSARRGHHFIGVRVRLRNVASYANCTYLKPQLRVDAGYVYDPFHDFRDPLGFLPGHDCAKNLDAPDYHNVPPAAEAEGIWTFEVKDGVKPTELVLYAYVDRMCAETQHRPELPSGKERVITFKLTGVPELAARMQE